MPHGQPGFCSRSGGITRGIEIATPNSTAHNDQSAHHVCAKDAMELCYICALTQQSVWLQEDLKLVSYDNFSVRNHIYAWPSNLAALCKLELKRCS